MVNIRSSPKKLGRPSRKEREIGQRRREILGVAERLFSRKGFFKTSMAEIAHDAEFAVGSLYQFFASKDAVYVALMEEKFEEYLALVRGEVTAAKGVLEKVEALINTKVRFFEKHRNFFRIYVTEWGSGECSVKGTLGEKISARREDYVALVTAIMSAGIRSRVFKNMDPRDMAHLFDGMMNAIIHRWIVSAGDESLAGKSEVIRGVFLNGVLRETGGRVRIGNGKVV